MTKLIICRGLPGSGKSTWAADYVSKNLGAVIANRDTIRLQDGVIGLGTPKQEKKYTVLQHSKINNLLSQGITVVDDNTNLYDKYLNKPLEIAAQYDVAVEYQDFRDVDVWECVIRDAKRPRTVGASVIVRMAQRALNWSPPQPAYNPHNPNAIIIDVDGTIANMEGVRGPYEWGKVGLDAPYNDMLDLLEMLDRGDSSLVHIVVTGRDGSAEQQTRDWLDKHNVRVDQFHIRPENNTEPDWIIKERIFREHIEPHYNVTAVFDDRDQVVNMWRIKCGLRCLQVNFGNF